MGMIASMRTAAPAITNVQVLLMVMLPSSLVELVPLVRLDRTVLFMSRCVMTMIWMMLGD